MLITLKIIHFFCLFGGGAAMMGNGILMRKVMATGRSPDPMVAETMKRLGMIGLASIVLLWISGIVMLLTSGATPERTFSAKLLAAVVVLVAVLMISMTAAKAEKANQPPDFSMMKKLSLSSSVGAALAVIFAVVAFN